MKRRISFLLVFLLLFSLVPGEAWALDVRDSGSCGENVTWTLDRSGTLTISGTGAMTDYTSEFDLPWRSWVISAVVIQSGITRIGDYAFYKADLSSISIPTSVTSIGNYAFEFCRKLSSISIPNSVRNIGYYCFFECSGLETVVLPDALTVIEEDLFGACGKLSSITIPKSVTYIKIGAFDTDIGIKNVYYSGSKVEWDAILVEDYNTYLLSAEIHYQGNNSDIIAKGTWGDDGSISWTLDSEGVLTFVGSGKMSRSGPFNVDGEMEPTEVRSASRKLVIGGGITELDGYIFSRGWGGLTQLIISEGVTTIGELTFNNCYGLEYVSLPSTLSSIGLYAFDLSTLYTSKLKTAGPIGGGYNIEFAWSNTIPDNIFSGMELTDVTLPETVKKIGFRSFYGCSKLNNVNFPSSLKELGSFSFALTSLTDAILPDGVNKIGNAVFYECSKLEHVRIPNTITSLPNGAWNGGSFTGGVFSNCRSLAEINLPASLLDIGDYSFSGCSNLSAIVFPDNLSRIGASAFSGCTKLSSVVIPDSIRGVEDSTFSNCTSLSEVILPNNLENIGKESFNGSINIKSIVLPVSIKSIGADAFNYLSAKGVQTSYLSDVYYYGTQEQWNRISFGESNYGISDKVDAANIHYANTVTFSPNGNNASVNPNTKVVVNGLLYGELPTPSRNGYGFDGWFSSATGGTRITAETLVSATGNHTLYAHWNPNSFTVSFNPNASDASVSPTSKTVTNGGTYGELPTANRNNYRFDGWFTSASGGTQITSSTTVNLSANQMLYAHWTYAPASYTVTFDPNASDATVSPTSKTVTNGETYGELPTANRINYRFDGWFTSTSGGTQITSNTTVNLSANQTLYAHWSIDRTPSLFGLSYSFRNSYEGFGYPNPYYIPFERYELIFGNTVKAKTLFKLQYIEEDGDWGGSCYGMSATTGMFYQENNGVDLNAFQPGASIPADLLIDNYNESFSLTLTEYIEAMQVSQFTDQIQMDFDHNNDLEALAAAVNSFSETGDNPVIIAVMRQMPNCKKAGHALVGYKIERVNATTSKLFVYDCNYPNMERFITLTTNTSGAYTGWYYHLNDRYDWGSAFSGCSISYIPYSDYYSVWTNRGSKNALCTLTLNSDVLIRDMDGTPVATVESGELFTGRDDIHQVAYFGIMADGDLPFDQGTAILLPPDLYTVEQLYGPEASLQSGEDFEISMLHIEQSASISTSAGKVTFAVDDVSGINYVSIDADENGSYYDVVLNSSLAGDYEEVQLTGTVSTRAMALMQINGSLSVNGAGTNARLLVDGQEVNLGGVSSDVNPVISFSANGGTGTMSPRTADANGEVVLPICSFTPPEGYFFRAWQINEREYLPGEICVITENTAATAIWSLSTLSPYLLEKAFRDGNSVSVRIQNRSGSEAARLMIALYDENGRLIDCDSRNIWVSQGAFETVTFSINYADADTIRAFLTDPISSRPLSEARTAT